MKLSIIIPAHNEAGCIAETISTLYKVLTHHHIENEILVVNDHSKDKTEELLQILIKDIPSLKYLNNDSPNGFGYAVRLGLEEFSGDCVALMMADLSDDPEDLVRFYTKMQEGYDCVFGTRWSLGGKQRRPLLWFELLRFRSQAENAIDSGGYPFGL